MKMKMKIYIFHTKDVCGGKLCRMSFNWLVVTTWLKFMDWTISIVIFYTYVTKNINHQIQIKPFSTLCCYMLLVIVQKGLLKIESAFSSERSKFSEIKFSCCCCWCLLPHSEIVIMLWHIINQHIVCIKMPIYRQHKLVISVLLPCDFFVSSNTTNAVPPKIIIIKITIIKVAKKHILMHKREGTKISTKN